MFSANQKKGIINLVQGEKIKKTIKSISISETKSKSTYCMVDFMDDSRYSFFKSKDVDFLRNCNNGNIVCFTGFQKGDWNNGKDVEKAIVPGSLNQEKQNPGISDNDALFDLMVEIKDLLIEIKTGLKDRRL